MSATTYQRQYHSFNEDGKITVNGEIVHVEDNAKGMRRGAEVLVKLPDSAETDEKGEEPDHDDETYYCVYERDNGERCSREVDNPGEYCWQHPPISGDDDE